MALVHWFSTSADTTVKKITVSSFAFPRFVLEKRLGCIIVTYGNA